MHSDVMVELTAFCCMQAAEAPRVDVAEAQPLENYPRAVQEHICASLRLLSQQCLAIGLSIPSCCASAQNASL